MTKKTVWEIVSTAWAWRKPFGPGAQDAAMEEPEHRGTMGSKKKRKIKKSQKRSPGPSVKGKGEALRTPVTPDEAPSTELSATQEIRRFLEEGKIKFAIDRAKFYEKQFKSQAIRDVLLEAYVARIREMTGRGFLVEARALLQLVQGRYDLPADQFEDLECGILARSGNLQDLVKPLNDPNLSPKRRAAIEKTVREEITDLRQLAAVPSLAEGHPIRTEARAILSAFEAVTTGPFSSKDHPGLNQIPRRSPLGPWKMLIYAVAALYAGEHESCERFLKAIPADAAPARLAPAIRAMATGHASDRLTERASDLVQKVLGSPALLMKALEHLEKACATDMPFQWRKAVKETVAACKKVRPDFLERLRQHITVRILLRGAEEHSIWTAMGDPPLKNAYFWGLRARAAELKKEWCEASALWSQFILHARHEGLFSENAKLLSLVYLQMAGILKNYPSDEFDWNLHEFRIRFRGFDAEYANQPPSVSDALEKREIGKSDSFFLHPETLYQMACQLDPDPAGFREWLTLREEKGLDWKQTDEVALAWHQAVPEDAKPLLALSRSAEKRNAFQKALKYLEQAEERERLNPEVKRARVRLLVSIVTRHLGQKKVHLAKKDLQEMSSLASFQEGDRPAFLTALKHVCAVMEKQSSLASRLEGELIQRLGDAFTASMVLEGLLTACGISAGGFGKRAKASPPPEGLALALSIARASALAEDMGIPTSISRPLAESLETLVREEGARLDISALLVIGDRAMEDGFSSLAYTASGAALRKNEGSAARLLLVRARSLPRWEKDRRNACIRAALALARRDRDMDLLNQIIEFKRKEGRRRWEPFGLSSSMYDISQNIDMEEVQRVLEQERESRDYPARPLPGQGAPSRTPRHVGQNHDDCRGCNETDCQDRRAPYDPDWDDDDWYDDDDDDDWYDDDDDDWDDDDFDEEDDDLDDDEPSMFPGLDLETISPSIRKRLEKIATDLADKYGKKGRKTPSSFEEMLLDNPMILMELLQLIQEEGELGDRDKAREKRSGKKRKGR